MPQDTMTRAPHGGPSPRPAATAVLLGAVGTLLAAAPLAAQQRVTGRVTTATGAPVPEVQVRVKGTQIGARADSTGRYVITARTPGDTLVFQRIGFGSLQVGIAGRSTVDVQLQAAARTLEEVVAIGYGQKSRATLTESIGTVAADEITRVPVASPDQAIQGRVAGVQVTSTSGTPGAPVAIRIRGVSTVGNTQPLYVVDGVPVGRGDQNDRTNPLSTLNPNDIENISVLKDASAAAVYGVQAANGVVLITTKRGRLGKPTVGYESYVGVQRLPSLWRMNSTQAYVQLQQDAYDAFNRQNNLAPGDNSYLALHPDLAAGSAILQRNTDWLGDAVNQSAPIQNHHLSVSGATDQLDYFVSGGYFGQSAVADRWDLNRTSFRANSSFRINPRLRVGESLTLSYQRVLRGVNGGGDGFLLRNAAQMPPFFRIRDTDGTVPNNRFGYDGNLNLAGLIIGNQNGINQVVDNRDRVGRVLGSLFAELGLFGNRLTLRSQGSVDYQDQYDGAFSPAYSAAELGLPRDVDQYGDSRGQNTSLVVTNTATYADSLGAHHFNVLGGIETQQYRGTAVGVSGQGFLSTDPNYYRVVRNAQELQVDGGASENAFLGYIGRLSYDYARRYLATFTVRRDGTSIFSPEDNRRWGTFPSVSAAWRVSEEPFFRLPAVSDLKLRGSFGELGNSSIGTSYPFLTRVTVNPDYGLGGTTTQAPAPLNFANPNLTWETVRTGDVGVEGGLFNNAVDFSATYYRRTTSNFLVLVPVPRVTGFANAPVNAGSVLNSGVELELGFRRQLPRGVNLGVSGNLTTIRNRLTALTPGTQEFLSSGAYRTAVGQPIGYIYGYRTAGLYQTPEEAAAALPDRVTGRRPQPGDVRFVDVNGPAGAGAAPGQQFSGQPDGLITPDDRAYLGKTIPDYFYGLNANLSWRRFDLSALFQGVQGVQIYNEFRRVSELMDGGGRNQLATTAARWTGAGTSTSMPRAVAGDPSQNGRISDRFVEDGSYFRLRNLQLGYTLPSRLFGATLRTARVNVTATNLFTLTGYSGLDPEVSTFGTGASQLGAATDQGNIPQPRLFQLGLTLGF